MSLTFLIAAWILIGLICSPIIVRWAATDMLRWHGRISVGDATVLSLVGLIAFIGAPVSLFLICAYRISEAAFWNKTFYSRKNDE